MIEIDGSHGEGGGSVSETTRHLQTNLWVMEKFQWFSFEIQGEIGKTGKVEINGGQ
jgi:RNA 3'-terminal phosphate cyclase